MTPAERRAYTVVRRLPRRGPVVVAEVGVLIGRMSEAMLRFRNDLKLLMIDSWAPEGEQPVAYRQTGDDHARHDESRAVAHKKQAMNRARHFPGRARLMHMTSFEAAKKVANASLDLVFLDADHSYEGVTADLKAWVPKVKPGGYIGGHDYQNPEKGYDFTGVERAVNEWAKQRGCKIEIDENFTWFCRIAS